MEKKVKIITFYHDNLWWAEYDGDLGVFTASGKTEQEAVENLEKKLAKIQSA